MNTIAIVVYKDTINNEHNSDDNLSCIYVEKKFAELYFLNKINKDDYSNFAEFIDNYTADDTTDFYKFVNECDAIIRIEDM